VHTESWKTEDKALIERVRKMPVQQVRKVLSEHSEASGYAKLKRKGNTPAVFYNRLMVLLTEGKIPLSAINAC
jgi:hypothetical protein